MFWAATATLAQAPAGPDNSILSATERWVWSKLLATGNVDLTVYCNEQESMLHADGENYIHPRIENPFRKPKNDAEWDRPCRAISSEFVRRIVVEPRWRDPLAGRVILIKGVRVRGGLDFSGSRVSFDLGFDSSNFDAIEFEGTKFDGSFGLERTLADSFNGMRARVGGDLFISQSTIGHIYLNSSIISGSGGIFESNIRSLSASGARVENAFGIEKTMVQETIALQMGRFGAIFLAESTLKSFDLSGSVINSELQLCAPGGGPLRWIGPGEIILRNVQAGALEDDAASWPIIIDLRGFSYKKLGGAQRCAGSDPYLRSSSLFVDWLSRSPGLSRQPYQQLASIIRDAGYRETAEDILYALRERDRVAAGVRGEWIHWAGMTVLKLTIGYGIGDRLFRALWWVLGLTAIGIVILMFSPQAREKGLPWCSAASLDQLLPIVNLNPEFDNFFDDPLRERLNGLQLAYFVLHALAGYLLGIFVAAAISGLTQAS
jgi:hypothetical protein